jgi:hypothetical protein
MMFARLGIRAALFSALVALTIALSASFAGAASVNDAAGDSIACSGECSNGDTDIKSLTGVVNGANLDVTVSQYGTGGCGSFTNVGYWPLIEIYTNSADPAGAPSTSFTVNSGDFALIASGNGNCGLAATTRWYSVRAVPTTYLFGAAPTLATVTASIPEANTATLSVPLAALGSAPNGIRLRAWQTSATPAGAVDVAPDSGTLAVDGSSSGGNNNGGGVTPLLNNLGLLPKSAALSSSFSGKLDLAGTADSIDLALATGSGSAARAAKSKLVGKKTLTHVGPGVVKFKLPIKKSFRNGIKKGKKVKLTFKAVVHVSGAQPITLMKKISFKKP